MGDNLFTKILRSWIICYAFWGAIKSTVFNNIFVNTAILWQEIAKLFLLRIETSCCYGHILFIKSTPTHVYYLPYWIKLTGTRQNPDVLQIAIHVIMGPLSDWIWNYFELNIERVCGHERERGTYLHTLKLLPLPLLEFTFIRIKVRLFIYYIILFYAMLYYNVVYILFQQP